MTFVHLGAALVLAGVMAWSGWAKLKDNGVWRQQLTGFYLPRPARILGWLVLPWVEIVCALGLAYRAAWAAAAVIGLMLVFSALVVRARLKQTDNKVGCGCFGGRSLHDYRLLLARNAGLAALGAVVLAGAEDAPGLSVPGVGALALLGLAALGWIAAQVVSHLRSKSRISQP